MAARSSARSRCTAVLSIALDVQILRRKLQLSDDDREHLDIALEELARLDRSVAEIVTVADLTELQVRAEIDEADIAKIVVGKAAYATADAYGDRKFPLRVTRITGELGRKTVRDDDPRARFETRVLEVLARFQPAPAEALPLGLRMYVHLSDDQR